ncbi:FAD:protein FMN transferase [Intrasporangium sp.]|uniref:FAD:protein FMN transferase n=1 Tax=Intrasporangium sp. TaxID=1925024 RepID=UPI0029399B91|nr:FAD:protein FMN transferase [Intrasporangium sp.]MDV3221497.1 FAD:protein FMN transferase [Intrasporangium sp.]
MTAPTDLRWSSLGTYVHLATSETAVLEEAGRLARDVLAAVDRTCSRFRPDSDLVRANGRAGTWVAVDPLLVAAVGVAVEAARETDGLVDPCLGRSLIHLGYDADLRVVQRRPDLPRATPAPSLRPRAWREIGLDPEGAIRVPEGCALDLGATGKAWASDLVAAAVVDRFGCHVIVSVGGDVRVDGPSDTAHAPWPVSITERPDADEATVVWLDGGGLATSGTTVRTWFSGGEANHHLLDPRTGRPVSGFWRTATATGRTCVAANTATTAALVLGADAVPWLDRRSVAARLVAADGSVRTVAGWPPDEAPTGRPPRPSLDRSA